MNINIKNIDASKADLGLRHDYIPKIKSNEGLDDEKKIVVECEYLRVGEKAALMSVDTKDRDLSLDVLRKTFRKKVRGIRNLTINEKPVTTAEELLKYPAVVQLEALIIDVVNHIIDGDELTEDEVKNLS